MTPEAIAEQFLPDESVISLKIYGDGLINDTYLIRTRSISFILQKINNTVFPEPEKLMVNLESLFTHILKQPADSVQLKFPEIIKTRDGKSCYFEEGVGHWRALSFIENTITLENIESHADAEQAGFTLGHFHRLTSRLDPRWLHDTLPGFHITPVYVNRYQAVKQKPANNKTSAESLFCEKFIQARLAMADTLEKAKHRGLLPLRIIHGDPKLNNILFDRRSREAVSIIDLDTVKPGLVHYDIGDCLRSCCNTEQEDSETAHFELDICAALLKSYLSETQSFFSQYDYDYLYDSIKLIPFELGVRFYMDYLEGNRYFKVNEPDQNLHRAKAQFHLLESIERQGTHIRQLVNHLRTS